MTATTTKTRSDNVWEEEVEDWATWLMTATQQQLDAECSFHWNFLDNDVADADGIECRHCRRTRRRSSSSSSFSLTPVSRLPFWMLLVVSVILVVLLPSQQLGGGDGERAQPSPSWVVSSFQPSPSLYYSGSGRAIQANFQRSLSSQQRSRRILCKTYTGGSNTDPSYPSAAINTRRSLPLKSRTTGTARAFSSSASSSSTTTALQMVWWYGGSESVDEVNVDQQGLVDSCELVAVRIERTSPNSRRIVGEIIVPTPVDDVWAILTDYDRLALHVPNLVESKIIPSSPSQQQQQQQQLQRQTSQQGDGNYSCRLFQRGAQKIVGFDFSAAVTMDMQERIVPLTSSLSSSSLDGSDGSTEERRIYFKCVESFFFQEFDGTWKAQERINDMTGQSETVLSYSVDVRPKGPVPVAALEWRIREDVPTNLRAVKKAAMQVGYAGVMAARYPHRTATATKANPGGLVTSATLPIRSQQTQRQQQQQQLLALPSVASSNDSSSKRMASPTNNRNNSSKEIAAKKPTSAAIFSSSSTTTTQRSTSLQERRNTVLSNLKVKWYKDETMATYLKDPQ